jgi:N-acetyl-anhydromuramyl-L-alanine amidase AmpD
MISYELTDSQKEDLKERGALMNGPDSVRWIVVHCSASRPTQEYTVADLERDHRKRGFAKIGYHFYIRKNGTLTQHRELLEVGVHCRPYNRCSIGVCYEGGVDENLKPKDTRTFVQRRRLEELLRELKTLFPQAIIMGHRDMPGARACDCPSFDATGEYSKLGVLRTV